MALVLKDRVREASYSTGTGAITMAGAYTGYQSFSSCIPTGSVVYYCITNGQAGHEDEWETGYGTYTLSTDELSRDFVYESSNANTLVNFSNPSTLTVFITQPADQAVFQQTNGDLKIIDGVIEVSLDGSEGTTLANATFQAFGTVNGYIQNNIQNLSGGAEASSDFVATNDIGNDAEFFVDLGINSSGFNSASYPIYTPNSGYVFSTGNGVATSNMFVGSGDGDVVLHAGGFDTANIVGTASGTDQSMSFVNDVNVGGDLDVTGAATFGSTVLLNQDPTLALQAATKQYVDQVSSSGLHIHDPVRVERGSNLTATYTQGGTTFNVTDISGGNTLTTSTTHGLSVNDQVWFTGTVGNGLSANVAYFVYSTPAGNQITLSTNFSGPQLTGLTNASGLTYPVRANSGEGAYLENSGAQAALVIDGVTVSVNDRVLVYGQATAYQNGVYTVTNTGSGSTNWVLTRALDQDHYSPADTNGMGEGDYFYVTSGDTGAGESYVLTTTGEFIIGYDALTYTQFSGAVTYTGGTNIDVSGQTISLTGTVAATNGGTGTNTVTTGDLLYGSGTNTWSKLASSGQYRILTMGASVPEWNALALNEANAVSGTLPETHGGTGQNTYALGDILYSSATNTLSKLAGQTTTTKKYLSQTGDGVNSAAPAWSQVAAADISGLAPSATTDTSNATNITSGTLPSGRLTGSYTGVTGVGALTDGTWTANAIGASYGGTGVAGTITGIPYANGASAYTAATGSQVVTLIGSNAVANATYAVSSNSSTYTSNIIGGAAGSIPYQTGANTTALLATGSGVLVGGTTPAWSTTPTLTGTNFSGIPNSATTAASANGASTIVARDINGSFAGNVVTATNFAGSGAQLTNLNASNVSSGTIPSAILGNSTVYIGTTAIALNRTTASQTLTGVSIDGSAGSAGTATNVAAANLTGSTLSSNVTSSSLTGVGTISSGTWAASAVGASYGGTGVAGTITGISYMNGASAHTAATAAQVVSVIGSTAVANATYATSAGSASTATSATTATTATTATNWGTYGGVPTAGSVPGANGIPRADASGYTYFNYINSNTANSENPGVGQVIVTNGSDNFYRKSSIASFTGYVQSNASGTWGINITGASTSCSGTAAYANNIESTQPAIGYSISGQNIDYGGQGGPQVRSQGGGAAMMSFHRPGDYAINFGLGTDNQLRTGGWSRGGNYVILDSGNYTSYAASTSGYVKYLSGAPAYTNGSDGWWRSSGQAGWYNSDYAVGIYATEAGNVRTYNGANFIAAGTVTANSDERLKENWRPVQEDFVGKLAEVKSGVYDRVDLEHHKTQAGVSAQSWQNLLPETVLEDSEGILSVAYGNAALVAAIELAKEVVKLREEIQALKNGA